MTEITAKTPWAGHTGDVPLHLNYFDGSMFEALELVAKKYPRNIAFDFMGKPTTYPQMIEEIKKCLLPNYKKCKKHKLIMTLTMITR